MIVQTKPRTCDHLPELIVRDETKNATLSHVGMAVVLCAVPVRQPQPTPPGHRQSLAAESDLIFSVGQVRGSIQHLDARVQVLERPQPALRTERLFPGEEDAGGFAIHSPQPAP